MNSIVLESDLAGETLHGLAKRHDLSRNLVRIWIQSPLTTKLSQRIRSIPTRQELLRSGGSSDGRRWRSSFKGGSDARTAAEKRDYIRDHRLGASLSPKGAG
jgi:hypothetical protein